MADKSFKQPFILRTLKVAVALPTVLFILTECRAATNGFQMQTITLPESGGWSRFVDLDGDRRQELIAIEPLQNRLAIYLQSAAGFATNPSQTLNLPPYTAWVTAHDLDPAPGLELLVSTPGGLFYFRHGKDGFESEPQTLIKTEQAFTNDEIPLYVSLLTNSALPVISANQAVMYTNTNGTGWRAGEPLPLKVQGASWFTDRKQWTAGPNSARGLHIQESVRAASPKSETNKVEEAPVNKLLESITNSSLRHLPGTKHIDLNGDKRKDLVVWDFFPGLDPKTDVYVFLRGQDDKLPDRPTQTLHCRGGPLPVGSTWENCPIADLKGDGTCELVLFDLATTLTSASSIVDMVLSGGLDCALTIRTFNHGVFSANPNATIPVRTVMPVTSVTPVEDMMEWPFFIHGDFNGDGRLDLVVRRSVNQWSILFSTRDEGWFAPIPAMSFETPIPGSLEIRDLNGDGLSDIVLRPENDPRIFVFLNQMQHKAKQ